MTRTERILIKPSGENYSAIALLCRKAKTIYNCANYQLRQSFINGKMMSWQDADKMIRCGQYRHQAYNDIPNAMSQAIIKKLGDDWKSFFEALRSFKASPDKFKARPSLPGYAKRSKTASMPFQHLQCKDSHIIFPKKTGINPIKTTACVSQDIKAKGDNQIILEVRVVPHGSCYWVEVVYNHLNKKDSHNKTVLLDKKNSMGIDLGINNLATIVYNQQGIRPVLVNGKSIKSINQAYNKDMAALRSKSHTTMMSNISVKRFCKMNDYMHKVSRYIIEQCLMHDVGTIVIGRNTDWKTGVDIGRVNNQHFTSLPHSSLIQKIKYKAEEYGIDVIDREESYTSKASALDCDVIPVHKKGQKSDAVFSGKRVHRGLYKTKNGLLINADVNGAFNILRKEVGDSFIEPVANEGLVFRPKRISFH